MRGRIRLLGTGASAGVPMIGCNCSTCTSTNVKNKRLRTSALLQIGKGHFLIDCSPDYRQQALTYSLSFPDALFLTHTHYDHVGGLEELRAYTIMRDHPIHCYLSRSSYENIKRLYFYHFTPKGPDTNFTPKFEFHVLDDMCGTIIIDGVSVSYCTYYQGGIPVTGFRFGSLAYITDIKTYDDAIFSRLHDLDILLLSALRKPSSRNQMTLEEAIAFARRVGAKETYLFHIAHEIEHEEENRKLPESMQLAYDGLELEFHV